MRHGEHEQQVAYFQWVRLLANTDPWYELIVAIPNAAKRSWLGGVHAVAEGLAKGFPDILLLGQMGNTARLAAIEMKVKPNKLSEHQERWREKLLNAGILYKLCYGLDEAMEFTKICRSYYVAPNESPRRALGDGVSLKLCTRN